MRRHWNLGHREVELISSGWKSPIGKCSGFVSASPVTAGPLELELVELDELVFGHTAAVLVTQGAQLQSFFPPNACFRFGGINLSAGPYILLKASLAGRVLPPLRLWDVVLAHLLKEPPEDMKKDEFLGWLLGAIK